MAVKKSIRFEDLDGKPVEEEWYFSLSEADAADMDLAHHENLEEYLSEMLKNKDSKGWISVLKEMLFASVGKREGSLLVKDESVIRQFKYGGAYKQLFAELIEMDDAGAEFFNSILPAHIQQRVAEEQSKVYSKDDMIGMTDEEFFKAFGKDETKYSPEQLLVAFQRRSHKSADAA
jgi:hypothetical protein